MTDSLAVNEAVRATAATAADAAFTWDNGALLMQGGAVNEAVPEIAETARNAAGLTVHLDRELPENFDWLFMNVRSTNPELEDETIGARRFYWSMTPRLWIAVSHPTGAVRQKMVRAMVEQLETVVSADRTLSGACDSAWVQPPLDIEEESEIGFVETLFVAIPIMAYFETTKSSG